MSKAGALIRDVGRLLDMDAATSLQRLKELQLRLLA